MPETRPPQALTDAPYLPALMPAFIQHLAVRWAQGGLPFSGGDALHSRLWLQLRGEPVAPELMAILFADAMPSPVMAAARGRVAAASLAWSIELMPAASQPVGTGWWRADTDLTGNADGYANQYSTIWTPDGRAAAFSHQVVILYG